MNTEQLNRFVEEKTERLKNIRDRMLYIKDEYQAQGAKEILCSLGDVRHKVALNTDDVYELLEKAEAAAEKELSPAKFKLESLDSLIQDFKV